MSNADRTQHVIEFDEGAGILVSRLHGFLDEDAALRYGRELAMAVTRARAGNRPLLFLVDNREGRVVSPLVAQALIAQLEGAKQPGDRTAIIVSDSLGKLQARRVTTTEKEVFLSEDAARLWLTTQTNIERE